MKKLCALAIVLLAAGLATMNAPASAGMCTPECCNDPARSYMCCVDLDKGVMTGSDAVTIGELRVGGNHVYRVDQRTVRIVNPRPGESALGHEIHFVNGKGMRLLVFDESGKFRVPSKFLFVHWGDGGGDAATDH